VEQKIVKDLMLSLAEYATVSQDATILEALAALSKAQMGLDDNRHHHRAVLALDNQGKVVGKLSHWAIIRSLEPKLLGEKDVQSLARAGLKADFIRRLTSNLALFAGDLSRMCQDAAKIRVRDAMIPIDEGIDEHAKITDAIHMLVMTHDYSTLVTRNGEVIGILRLADVFEEVADIIRCCAETGPNCEECS
jgi:CBS domain-containing protein